MHTYYYVRREKSAGVRGMTWKDRWAPPADILMCVLKKGGKGSVVEQRNASIPSILPPHTNTHIHNCIHIHDAICKVHKVCIYGLLSDHADSWRVMLNNRDYFIWA